MKEIFKKKIHLTCSLIFEKLANLISMEFGSKDGKFLSVFIVDFRTLSKKCIDFPFPSVLFGVFGSPEKRNLKEYVQTIYIPLTMIP